MEKMNLAYLKKCDAWMLKAKKATASKSKAYAKVALPHYDGTPFTNEEFEAIMSL